MHGTVASPDGKSRLSKSRSRADSQICGFEFCRVLSWAHDTVKSRASLSMHRIRIRERLEVASTPKLDDKDTDVESD